MNPLEARQERRQLKQKLFQIRLALEAGRAVPKELLELKATYEALPGFTRWSDFPEKWDIGDPNRVKEHVFTFDEVDKQNVKKILGHPYETIVALEQRPEAAVMRPELITFPQD